MKSRIGLLVLLVAAPLTHAQLPEVAAREAESILVFFRGLDYVEASRMIGVNEMAGRRKVSGTDLEAARKALDQALDDARQDSGPQKEAADLSGKTAREAWERTVNQIRAAAKVAAKEPVTRCPVSPFNPSGSCSSKRSTWQLYPTLVSYRVDGPLVLGYSKVKVGSLIVYGSPALVDYLFRSRFIDCGYGSSCKSTSLSETQPPPDAHQGGRVKLLLDKPQDFAEFYNHYLNLSFGFLNQSRKKESLVMERRARRQKKVEPA